METKAVTERCPVARPVASLWPHVDDWVVEAVPTWSSWRPWAVAQASWGGTWARPANAAGWSSMGHCGGAVPVAGWVIARPRPLCCRAIGSAASTCSSAWWKQSNSSSDIVSEARLESFAGSEPGPFALALFCRPVATGNVCGVSSLHLAFQLHRSQTFSTPISVTAWSSWRAFIALAISSATTHYPHPSSPYSSKT
jgi:hypothetical protein